MRVGEQGAHTPGWTLRLQLGLRISDNAGAGGSEGVRSERENAGLSGKSNESPKNSMGMSVRCKSILRYLRDWC
jgi:hypothetical protein